MSSFPISPSMPNSISAPPTDDVAHALPPRSLWRLVAGIIISLVALWLAWFLITNPRFEWPVVARYLFDPQVLKGLGVTVMLTVLGMIIGTFSGTIAALLLMSDFRAGRLAARGYLWAFRATPLMIQLLFWYNLAYLIPTISIGLPFSEPWVSWETTELISPFTAALLGLGLAEGAYMAEIIRAGLLSVDSRQSDAAKALGMTPTQTFFRIVCPQAMRVIIPPTGNQFISLAKGTALVSVIAMNDLLFAVQSIYNRTYEVVPLLMVAVIWYLALITLMYVVQARLERHYGRGHAPAPTTSSSLTTT